ncbi:MAG: hypothetical protein ACOZAQ_10610 [Pseudomonadota bacterium]
MHASLHELLHLADQQAHRLSGLVWEAAHYACARLTHDLPEAVAHELADRKLEETLTTLAGDVREQYRFLARTLGEAEAMRRLRLALDHPMDAAA